ncbi:MAG TPA: M28 family peptidase [Candidatus Aminicenantes bacterium]|nr:M28 family peptidase [Candidatus Aminicenantes bacterium]
MNKKIFVSVLCVFLLSASFLSAQRQRMELTQEQKLLQVMHSIHSQTLFDYVKELSSDKYWGRLTGTDGYNQSAQWVISHFKKWGLLPAGDENTYLQAFPNPYTLVFKDCYVSMNIPVDGETVQKYYTYEEEFIPGSTSGSGEVTAEVVYVGYGITAPELDFDEYKGMDVKGKIVLMEREAPVSPDAGPEIFNKWRPYSFHQYKLKNAVAHGARGMLYNYHITNPNNAYDENFIYSHVGETVVNDVFAGTGKKHADLVARINKELKPQSFDTGKVFTIKNTTEHHPDGIAYNVLGMIKGSDPVLKDEIIIIGGHLDHLGRCYEIIPGANDNASAVAVIMGIAEAMAKSPVQPRRSVLFMCFGAEEQGVVGSKFYVENPVFPLEKTVCLINMDGVGAGDKLSALCAEDFPELWSYFKKANDKYTHRLVFPSSFANLGRPRLDAARFLWAGVPSLSFSAFGTRSYYHVTKDNIDTITPEIMEDLAQMIFMAVLDLANEDKADFRKAGD